MSCRVLKRPPCRRCGLKCDHVFSDLAARRTSLPSSGTGRGPAAGCHVDIPRANSSASPRDTARDTSRRHHITTSSETQRGVGGRTDGARRCTDGRGPLRAMMAKVQGLAGCVRRFNPRSASYRWPRHAHDHREHAPPRAAASVESEQRHARRTAQSRHRQRREKPHAHAVDAAPRAPTNESNHAARGDGRAARGGAAAGDAARARARPSRNHWTLRGGGSRHRRGARRGNSVETDRDVGCRLSTIVCAHRLRAAPPRGATWTFRGDGSR